MNSSETICLEMRYDSRRKTTNKLDLFSSLRTENCWMRVMESHLPQGELERDHQCDGDLISDVQ